MPLYRYRCKNCGHEFEKLVNEFNKKVNDELLCQPVWRKVGYFCEKCGSETEQLIGKPAVHYKGNNFTKEVEDDGN